MDIIKVSGIDVRDNEGNLIYKWEPNEIKDLEIRLEPEPKNPFDPNAVKVIIGGTQVGYISKDIAPYIDVERKYKIKETGYFNNGKGDKRYLHIVEVKSIVLDKDWEMDQDRIRYKDGKSYINISKILDVFKFPDSQYWEKIKVGMFKDHFHYMDWLGKKADLGSAIHKCIEQGKYSENVCEEYKVDCDEVISQLKRYSKWIKTEGIEIISNERVVSDEDLGVASPCDLLIEHKGKKYIVDIKTGSQSHKHQVQAYFYSECMSRELGEEVLPSLLYTNTKTKIGYSWKKQFKITKEEARMILKQGSLIYKTFYK